MGVASEGMAAVGIDLSDEVTVGMAAVGGAFTTHLLSMCRGRRCAGLSRCLCDTYDVVTCATK